MKEQENETKTSKKPWRTKDAMEQIYKMRLWGGAAADFYSGEGSHRPQLVNPYITALTLFLTAFKNPLIVCDLGCGDFNVGKELVKYTKNYIAVDIVPDLIARNKERFKEANLEFQCLDIATVALPTADCVLLRQVLQHLSNAEVLRIVSKLAAYKYVIVTEHLPNRDFEPNMDIISGQGTRIKKQSGIDLLAAPFYMKVKEVQQLLAINLNESEGIIVTTLYTMF